jgi:hypothetical protein
MLSCVTVMSSAVNVAMQPLSHNWPMLSSECGFRCGNTCAEVAGAGRVGRCTEAVPVDTMEVPSHPGVQL